MIDQRVTWCASSQSTKNQASGRFSRLHKEFRPQHLGTPMSSFPLSHGLTLADLCSLPRFQANHRGAVHLAFLPRTWVTQCVGCHSITFTGPRNMPVRDFQGMSVAALHTEVCGGVLLQVRCPSYFMSVLLIDPGTLLGPGDQKEKTDLP